MKIGCIGLGDIAQKAYLPVLATLPGVELHLQTRTPATLDLVADTLHLVALARQLAHHHCGIGACWQLERQLQCCIVQPTPLQILRHQAQWTALLIHPRRRQPRDQIAVGRTDLALQCAGLALCRRLALPPQRAGRMNVGTRQPFGQHLTERLRPEPRA